MLGETGVVRMSIDQPGERASVSIGVDLFGRQRNDRDCNSPSPNRRHLLMAPLSRQTAFYRNRLPC